MKTITVVDAAADFRRLVDEVANGETFVITRGDIPVAQIVPPVADPDRLESTGGRDVVAEWEEYRRQNDITLGEGLTIRELIDDGRKY